MKRSELYERVWSTPATKIAEELGISGSRVAAICKRHGIPTPPRGYWAKLTAGKQLPAAPLPLPESDYEIKVGKPAASPAPSAWVAPGVLLRAAADHPPSGPEPEPATSPLRSVRPTTPELVEVFRPAPAPTCPAPRPDATGVDLELVRAAAVELQGIQAVRDLLQAVAACAVHARPDEAQRIVAWTAAVRVRLEERDPIAALLRLATQGQ